MSEWAWHAPSNTLHETVNTETETTEPAVSPEKGQTWNGPKLPKADPRKLKRKRAKASRKRNRRSR